MRDLKIHLLRVPGRLEGQPAETLEYGLRYLHSPAGCCMGRAQNQIQTGHNRESLDMAP
jgi:hypothetical protein